MTDGRIALLVGFAVALVMDAYAYSRLGVLRAIVTQHHWIFYLYLTVLVTLAVAGVVRLLLLPGRRRARP